MSNGIFDKFINMPRYGPAIFAAFLFFLSLLFIRDLSNGAREYLIPSILLYALGASLLGTFHRLLGLHYVEPEKPNNEMTIPVIWKIAIWLLHGAWFAALVSYNFSRGGL